MSDHITSRDEALVWCASTLCEAVWAVHGPQDIVGAILDLAGTMPELEPVRSVYKEHRLSARDFRRAITACTGAVDLPGHRIMARQDDQQTAYQTQSLVTSRRLCAVLSDVSIPLWLANAEADR